VASFTILCIGTRANPKVRGRSQILRARKQCRHRQFRTDIVLADKLNNRLYQIVVIEKSLQNKSIFCFSPNGKPPQGTRGKAFYSMEGKASA
jgi:hypothetical protein